MRRVDGTYPLVPIVRIDVFDGDGRQFRRVDGIEPDGQWHALLQRRIRFGPFVFVLFVVPHLLTAGVEVFGYGYVTGRCKQTG